MADPRYEFRNLFFQAITPIHVGSGQDVGLVDLPVIRERTTDHPFLPGSGIRGALRARCNASDLDTTVRLFGSEGGEEIRSGCLSVLDAHLLLFPVRSAPGIFSWITCPFVLQRFERLCRDLRGEVPKVADPVPASFLKSAKASEGRFLGASQLGDQVYLEEYPFQRAEDDWEWKLPLQDVQPERVALLGDRDFLHFVQHATLVRTRNRLSTAKTVLQGHLFSVESLPPDSWFYGFLGATTERYEPATVAGSAARTSDETKGGSEPSHSNPPDTQVQGASHERQSQDRESAGDGAGDIEEPDVAKSVQLKPWNPNEANEQLLALLPKPPAAQAAKAQTKDRADHHSTFLTLGGDESVGLGITRMWWDRGTDNEPAAAGGQS